MPADGFDAAAKNRDLGTSRWQLLKGQWAEHTSVARMSEEAWRSQCPAIRPLSGDKRKWLRHRQADVIDPNRTCAPPEIFHLAGLPEVFQVSSLNSYNDAF